MKGIISLIKIMLLIAMIIVSLPAIFIFWRTPDHALESGIAPIFAYLLTAGIYLVIVSLELIGFFVWRLVRLVERDLAFTVEFTAGIRKLCFAFVTTQVSLLFTLPAIYQLADREDAPGMILMLLFAIFVPLLISLLLFLFEKVWQQAIIKK